MNNTKKESKQHNGMKALIGISVVLTSLFTAFIVSRSDCTGNWLDRNLRLSDEGCFKGSVSDLNYSDKKLTFTDQHGKSQAIDFSKFVDEFTTISSKGATPTVAFSLDGTKLTMFIGNKTTGETSSSVVDLSSLIGSGTDKDNQNLSLAGTILSIRNGNSIDLAAIASVGPRGPVGAAGLTGSQGLVGAPGPQGSPGVLTVSNGMLTLTGTDLSISSCAAAEILEYSGSAWVCANDNNTTYGAGNGLTLNSGTLELGGTLSRDTVIFQNGYNVEFDNILASGRTTELHLGDDIIGAGIEGVGFTSSDAANTGIMGYLFAGDATSSGGSANMAGVGLNDFATNEFAQYSAFDTGSGLGSRVASSSPLFSSDATWLNDQIQLSTSNSGGNSSLMLNPSALYVNTNLQFSGELRPGGNAGMANQVFVSAGPGSTPYWADPGTLLLAGAGVSIIGNTVAISSPVCSGADKLQWDGSVFLCSVDIDTDTTYTAGTGISFAGTTISATLGTDITSSEIVDGTITTVDLANDAVTSAKVLDGTVISADIADGTLLFADVAVNGCTANQIFKFNGVSWACGADTAGISSLNGLTTGTQTFAVGTSGTDFGIVSSGSAHTFNIPDASLTARGLVTTTAQTLNGVKTFNSGVVVSSTACASAASSNNVFCQGGNSYGVAAVIGTNDFQSLQLETAGTTAATISSGGEFLARDPTDSTVSFQIQNSANLPVLTIDTVNNRINVGSSTADANALTLVLDSYNNAIDPLGVDGSLYYNAALGKFRCYESGTWKDCIGGPMILRVASDVSNTSNVTYADVTGLTASVVAGRTYSFSCNLTYNTAVTTTAIHLSVNGPATSALDYAVLVQTTATAQHNAVQTAFNTVTNPATGGGATRLQAEIDGTFTPTIAGTFAVRLKSEVNASSVTVKRGSFCELY